ncbi:hypothetical protein [Neisseria viridiae]|uniref:hypothetical protein n=2 Tax=Neisseria viridiae TaxID=2830648 RepID=UPI002659510E|nr:hypothetical protein [Neisseria viridiae]
MNSLSVIGKIKAFIVFLLLVSSSAYASEFSDKFDLVYIDGKVAWLVGKDIDYMDGYRVGVMSIWAMDDVKELGLKKGWVLFSRIRVNCNSQSVGHEYMEKFDMNAAKTVQRYYPTLKMEPVDSEGALGKVAASVCNQKG